MKLLIYRGLESQDSFYVSHKPVGKTLERQYEFLVGVDVQDIPEGPIKGDALLLALKSYQVSLNGALGTVEGSRPEMRTYSPTVSP